MGTTGSPDAWLTNTLMTLMEKPWCKRFKEVDVVGLRTRSKTGRYDALKVTASNNANANSVGVTIAPGWVGLTPPAERGAGQDAA